MINEVAVQSKQQSEVRKLGNSCFGAVRPDLRVYLQEARQRTRLHGVRQRLLDKEPSQKHHNRKRQEVGRI